MTISSETNRVQFAGSGTTGPFTISSLEIQDDTQVAVTHTDSSGVNTDYVLTTDYTINTALTELTTVANVESGETLTVIIDVALTQGVDHKNTGTFDAEVNEDALDKGILIDKQQTEQLARTIKLKVNSTATDITIEDGVEDKGLKFDASGNLIITDNDIDTALDAAAASAAAAAVSETNAATSETNAASSESSAAADAALTAADVISTNADVVSTNADVVSTNADVVLTNADVVSAEAAASAVAHPWLFDATTTMADPGTGDIRLNNATVSSVTQIVVSASTADTGNPDISAEIITWDDSTSTVKGTLILKKSSAPATFATFTINGTITDNTTWLQIPVTHVASNGALSASDKLHTQFIRTGDQGAAGTGALDNVVDDTTPQLGGDLDCNGSQIQWSKGADVASAAALAVLTDGNYFDVTGTTAITSINTTGGAGTQIKLHFDGVLTLTHHATNLVLPGGANITTAAGDEAEFIEYGAGTYRCTSYSKADGTSVVAAGGGSLVLLDTQTASTSASIAFSSTHLTTTYKEYIIEVIDAVPATDGVTLTFVVSEDNGSTYKTSAAYDYTAIYFTSGSALAGSSSQARNDIPVTINSIGSTAGESISVTVKCYDPLGTAAHKGFTFTSVGEDSTGDSTFTSGATKYIGSVNAVNNIKFLFASGNITSGTFKLYGVL